MVVIVATFKCDGSIHVNTYKNMTFHLETTAYCYTMYNLYVLHEQ